MIIRANSEIKRTRIRIKQTFATLLCEQSYIRMAHQEILRLRKIIETHIVNHPEFASSLVPVGFEQDAPEIIKGMIRASNLAGSGPMSAVAGAIAGYTVRKLVAAGARHVIMENGGDIAMKLDRPTVVGIYTGAAGKSNIGFRLEPEEETFGICTSSGSVGHSLSLGCADAATVIARDVSVADAMATVLGNQIKNREKTHIQSVLNSQFGENVKGMMVVVDDVIGLCGQIPPLVRTDIPLNKISMG